MFAADLTGRVEEIGARYRFSLTILVRMKLAEALALRADAARRAEQLRARIAASARYQEGETPAEDATVLCSPRPLKCSMSLSR